MTVPDTVCETRTVGEDTFVHVHLLGLPLQARTGFSQHLQDLARELSLIRIGTRDRPGTSLPPRLLEIAAELDTTYAAFRAAPDAAVGAALAAGADHCDVTYTVPPTAGAFLRRLGDVLEEADDYCRAERHLLSLPASEEVVAYRRWMVAEATRQLAGEDPRPWRRRVPEDRPAHGPVATAPGLPAPRTTAAPPASAPGSAGGLVREPLTMESVASSVGLARRHVRACLRDLGRDDLEDAAELGVSELVTNALLHARTAFTLQVRATDDGVVRIEVTDSAPAPLQPRRVTSTGTTGRGLQVVASSSSRWGVDELPPGQGPGKTVWFEPRADPEGLDADWSVDRTVLG